MAFAIPFLGTFGTTAAADVVQDTIAQETAYLNGLKQEALQLARDTAAREDRAPNLTDYWRAALTMPGLEGNARIISDLSGMTLDGFTIRYEDIHPTAEQMQAQMSDVQGPIIQPGSHNGVRELRNLLDADGNGTIEMTEISAFYSEVQAHMQFNGTQFHNVTFQPATTLEIFAHARGAQFANITLDGLSRTEPLTIGTDGSERGSVRESYSNVCVINDQGGLIRVNSNATVNGLTLENGNTVLEVANGGRVNALNVQSETVSLRMQPMGELFLPSFNGANFTPASDLGGVIRGNPMDAAFHGFRDSNLNGLQFNNANISGIDFVNCDMEGACFHGARLANVTFSRDIDLAAADLSGLRHAHNVQITDQGRVIATLNSPEELHTYVQATAIGRQMGQTMNSSTTSVAPVLGMDAAVTALNTEFRATPTTALLAQTVSATPQASMNGPAVIVSGGDAPINETPAQQAARLGIALTENFGQPVISANQNDVNLASQKALDTPDAIAARTELAMANFQRGDGRSMG